MKKSKLLYVGYEWDLSTIKRLWKEIDVIGKSYGLDYHQPQIELVSPEGMIDAYMLNGLPTGYNHWSYGKQYLSHEEREEGGQSHLAFEMIINSQPPIMYCSENNSATMQALVLAHAGVGHADFFKNNELFKLHADSKSILKYCEYAKKYISECEEIYGQDKITKLLDAAHSFQNYGVNKFIRSGIDKKKLIKKNKENREKFEIENHSILFEDGKLNLVSEEAGSFPEENILWFIEKYSPILDLRQKEIVRIVRKLAQYFFPQPRTKIMNEGWATFWEYKILTDLYNKGMITSGAYLEFIHLYSSGTLQQPGTRINPYALGMAIWKDIKRICLNPDKEDLRIFPFIANTDWIETFKGIRRDYVDSSFILQYLSPKVVRDFKFVCIKNDNNEEFMEVTEIHSDEDFYEFRRKLSNSLNMENYFPRIEIKSCDFKGDRLVHLEYKRSDDGREISDDRDMMSHYFNVLWGSAPVYNFNNN